MYKLALFVLFSLFIIGCVSVPINNPPTISGIPDITIHLGEAISAIDLWNYAADKEDPDSALIFSIESQSNSNVVECFVEGNRFLKSQKSKAVGDSEVTVKAKDTGGLSANDTFKIIVKPSPNKPPTIAGIPDRIVIVGQRIEPLDLWIYASDEEDSDSALNFSIVQQSNTSVINCYTEGNRYVRSGDAQNTGYSDITVKVIDSGDLSATDTFRVMVESSPNTPPTISGIPDRAIRIGQSIESIDLWEYAADKEDADSSLAFALQEQSDQDVIKCFIENVHFLKSDPGKFIGYSNVTVKVTDSAGLSATDTLRITVEAPVYRVHGLNFSPYMDGQDPNWGSIISGTQIEERMRIIAPYSNWIRTFGSLSGLEFSGRVAHKLGLKAGIGAWLSKDKGENDKQIESLISLGKAGETDLAIVGSEVLLRNDLSAQDLIAYLNRVRSALPGILITTSDVYSEFLTHPEVVDVCDVLLVNYYPYWEGIHIDNAVAYVHARHLEVVSKSKGKKVIVSETGWPSEGNKIGNALPSLENACFYFLNFVSWARANNVEYFYFEAFDEQWKERYEGPQGAHWGVWDKYGIMKPGMQDVFEGKTIPDNWTGREIPGGPGTPEIEFAYVPPYGSFENLRGQVWHVWPNDFRVAVYIYVVGGWWTKPYWDRPLTSIGVDGKWVCDITTGGLDERAIEIIAFLLPFGYDPPLASGQTSLPNELEQKAVAWIKTKRNPG